MKRKHAVRRHTHHRRVTHKHANAMSSPDYLVVVRGWMFVVAFALMLGLGALVGQFINDQLNATTPQVAGVQIEAE